MAVTTIDLMAGVTVDVISDGLDDIVKKVDDFVKDARALNIPLELIREKVSAIIGALKNSGRPLDAAFGNTIRSLRETFSSINLPREPFKQMENVVRRGAMALASLYTTIAPFRKLYRFADGVAQINKQLLLLSYNSRESMQGLQAIGNTLSVFGGSAKDVASAEKRYETTIAGARRGESLGYLQENAWKFGFGFDLNETYDQRFERAIQHYQQLSKQDRIYFAQAEGWTESQVAVANKGIDWYQQNKAEMSQYGGNKEEAAAAATDMAEATAKLKASWQDIKDRILIALVPLIKVIVGLIKGITDFLGKHKWLLTAIAYVAALIAARIAMWSLAKFIAQVKALIPLLTAVNAQTKAGAISRWSGGLLSGVPTKGGMKALGWIGAGMVALDAVSSAWSAYGEGNTAEGNKAVGRGVGSLGGMWAGGKLGAKIGRFFGPWGMAIGLGLGSLVGAFAGGKLGEATAGCVNSLGKFNDATERASRRMHDITSDFAEFNSGVKNAASFAERRNDEVRESVVHIARSNYNSTYNNVVNSHTQYSHARASVNVTQNFNGGSSQDMAARAREDITSAFQNLGTVNMNGIA